MFFLKKTFWLLFLFFLEVKWQRRSNWNHHEGGRGASVQPGRDISALWSSIHTAQHLHRWKGQRGGGSSWFLSVGSLRDGSWQWMDFSAKLKFQSLCALLRVQTWFDLFHVKWPRPAGLTCWLLSCLWPPSPSQICSFCNSTSRRPANQTIVPSLCRASGLLWGSLIRIHFI